MNSKHYIGLMSGTSMDGIDAALVSFDPTIQLHTTLSIDIPGALKTALTNLISGNNISLKLLGETDVALGELFATAVLQLLKKSGVAASDITAIGSHGQTIYHAPNNEHPFTLQIGDPNIIAARTGITTVADFRRRDVALGGQGAPLAPAFHAYLFARCEHDQWVLNLGGIANITYIPAECSKDVIGFDTGPANTLLDQWCEKNTGHTYDANGDWARSGQIENRLLMRLLDDPYFQRPFPKSTGREYFNLGWLDQKLKLFSGSVSAVDIQATLTELTAKTVADAITHGSTLWVCGGGYDNTYLIERIQAHCPQHIIRSTEEIGIAPKWIEAAAFAWLTKQTLDKKSGNLPSVTGAEISTILGGVYFGG